MIPSDCSCARERARKASTGSLATPPKVGSLIYRKENQLSIPHTNTLAPQPLLDSIGAYRSAGWGWDGRRRKRRRIKKWWKSINGINKTTKSDKVSFPFLFPPLPCCTQVIRRTLSRTRTKRLLAAFTFYSWSENENKNRGNLNNCFEFFFFFFGRTSDELSGNRRVINYVSQRSPFKLDFCFCFLGSVGKKENRFLLPSRWFFRRFPDYHAQSRAQIFFLFFLLSTTVAYGSFQGVVCIASIM